MLLEAKNLKKTFKNSRVIAVDNVSFSVQKGQTLGLVGESGSGKSTVAKLILRLIEPTSGEIYFQDQKISCCKESLLKEFRKKVQIIFQEPFLSLNPRMRVCDILKESFWIAGHRDKVFLEKKVDDLLHDS